MAQTQFGLRFSPAISSNRVNSNVDTLNISKNGVGIRFIAGVYADRFLGGNTYFSTGLFYAPKRVSFKATNTITQATVSETYNLQYLQIPASFKLVTGELGLDTRLFFQVGTELEIKIFDDPVETSEVFIEKFRRIDATLILGLGVEKRISTETNIYGGLTYYRGLFNVIASQFFQNQEFTVKNDLFSIDLMIRF